MAGNLPGAGATSGRGEMRPTSQRAAALHCLGWMVMLGGLTPFPYGSEICYLVRATFEDNLKTCTSNEVCVEIEKDFPVIMKDSVDITSTSGGAISVAWSQPTEIDTNFFPRPYTYTLKRADGISGPLVWQTVSSGIPYNDTTHYDTGLNTVDRGYRYRADVHDIGKYLMVLMNDKTLREKMGKVARERVVKNFDYRVVARKFVQIISDKLGIE